MGSNVALRSAYMAALAREASRQQETLPILRLDSKTGEFVYGEEKRPLGQVLVAVDVMSFKHGHIAFCDDAVALLEDGTTANFSYGMDEILPDESEYAPFDAKYAKSKNREATVWRYFIGVNLTIAEGDFAGTTVVYNPTSKGGVGMLRKLMAEIVHADANGNLDKGAPHIELYPELVKTKGYGDKWFPRFEVVEWKPVVLEGSRTLKAETVYDDEDEKPVVAAIEDKRSENATREHKDNGEAKAIGGRRSVRASTETVAEQPERETPRRRGR